MSECSVVTWRGKVWCDPHDCWWAECSDRMTRGRGVKETGQRETGTTLYSPPKASPRPGTFPDRQDLRPSPTNTRPR